MTRTEWSCQKRDPWVSRTSNMGNLTSIESIPQTMDVSFVLTALLLSMTVSELGCLF